MKWLDRPIQCFYQCIYPLVLLAWRLTSGASHGVQVAFWVDNRVLLVRNSYRKGYSFPGGDVKKRERPIDAACRELAEETGIMVFPDRLRRTMDVRTRNHGLTCLVEIFECKVKGLPNIRIDNREVVEALFLRSDDALGLCLLDSTRKYLLDRKLH